MTRDERIEAIRKCAAQHPNATTWRTGDISFLLAELDAAKVSVQRLTEALRRLTEPMCSIQRDNGIIRERLLAIAGDDAMDRYKDALAAIAEGAAPVADAWTRWWAWYPVRVPGYGIVWWEWIERRPATYRLLPE